MKNDTCIIIGNGPSLNDVPMGFLQKYPTWGVNKIFLQRADGHIIRPDYYVTVHADMAPLAEEIKSLNSQMFITDKIAHLFPGCQPIHSVGEHAFFKRHGKRWDLWEGWSVIYVCLQLAYWLDFRTALLVGLDHDYTFGSFHPDYDNVTGTDPHDQDKLLPAFRLAKQYWEADGRRIINITPNTKEPIFEKGYITKWFPSLLWE